MRSTATTAFTAEDLSVALLYYIEAKLQRCADGLEGVRRQLAAPGGDALVRTVLASQLDVDDSQVICDLRQIPVAERVDVSSLLSDDDYRTRLLEVALERLRVGPDAPALRIAPKPRQATALGINFALVFGAEATLFQDTVIALQTDETASRADGDAKVNVLGVHHSWLGEGMRARRALIADHSGRACEVAFSEPQPVQVVETLHLPRRTEKDLHRQISTACARTHIPEVNPYETASERADDKMQTAELWCSFRDADGSSLETPLARLVPRRASRDAVAAAARQLLNGRATAEVVVQPNHGTEGWLVEAGQVSAVDPDVMGVAQLAEMILPHDEVLIREARGNVRFEKNGERRRIAFRINVACDGDRFVAESGFAQVAPDATTFAASRGRGGEIVALDEALRSLCCDDVSGWHRVVPTASDLEAICAAASRAAVALNSGLRAERFLKHMGIDMVLEAHASGVTPVLLEANARPAGLASSRKIRPSWHGRLKPEVTTALFGFVRQLQR